MHGQLSPALPGFWVNVPWLKLTVLSAPSVASHRLAELSLENQHGWWTGEEDQFTAFAGFWSQLRWLYLSWGCCVLSVRQSTNKLLELIPLQSESSAGGIPEVLKGCTSQSSWIVAFSSRCERAVVLDLFFCAFVRMETEQGADSWSLSLLGFFSDSKFESSGVMRTCFSGKQGCSTLCQVDPKG